MFNIAAKRAGTRRKAVFDLAGQKGIDAVEEMLDAGLLIETPDGTIKYTRDSWALGNVDDALDQVRHSIGHSINNSWEQMAPVSCTQLEPFPKKWCRA